MIKDIPLPAIGDFTDVPVVEILVAPGDTIAENDSILVLESDKATLDVPSPVSGIVREVLVSLGAKVSAGAIILRIETETVAAPPPAADADHSPLVVIGAGPGGYTAAFRAADLGREVTLIDPRATLGGVCLNVGCIPSKSLLHIAKVIDEAEAARDHGLGFAAPEIDLGKIRAFKDGVVGRLTSGLEGLARRRKVRVIRGTARFTGPNRLSIDTEAGPQSLGFDQAIIAVGSEPVRLPFLPEDPRIIDSTGSLALAEVPTRMLVIGGGIIGLEMAQIYHALGAGIEIVEATGQIIPGADKDVVAPLTRRLREKGIVIHTDTRVTAVTAGARLEARFTGPKGDFSDSYDRILVAVGRRPNGDRIGAEQAGIAVSPQGFLAVDTQMRTSQPHIFAIGDVVGQPMLAHKATHEAKVAAEAACGETVAFEAACIPSVAYTDPEIAWVGLTEAQAKQDGIRVGKASFPWMASGRALSMGRGEGLTKLLFDPDSGRVLGGAITGANAGDLIAEVALAIEMRADAHDIALTIHPHPTLSETVAFAAEAHLGTLTDL
ncbi:dihydrolipoyl dehydrogenase [Pararhodobacter aggregans]|uniref:Dihydrolipoyl dehydrogenase n=1 Tax=Pararhodobacter aggregans TaxID=404875 RepID=A0A2T7UQ34_9RHOB|nr:dihydrolipoyl dehydrogenase [Pararhodobacter aggregans]PTX01513.1 dihydrolipoamide dehydrogenase [Pararhodobacter aggregans]PVE46782.1 dihydrolipoyl dehydrogenase [Pararhodobacter aggregans]